MASLSILAALGQPLLARMVGEFSPALGWMLPMVICVPAVCVIWPHRGLPEIALALIFLVELTIVLLPYEPIGPSVIRGLLAGRWRLLVAPMAALSAGHLAVRARRRRAIWPRPIKTNLRILAGRPEVFVRAYRWSLLMLVVGTTLDTMTTMSFMRRLGTSDELHPAMRMMAELFGIDAGVPLASLVRFGCVVFVAALWRRWCRWVLLLCGILYALAACSNHFDWMTKLQVWKLSIADCGLWIADSL